MQQIYNTDDCCDSLHTEWQPAGSLQAKTGLTASDTPLAALHLSFHKNTGAHPVDVGVSDMGGEYPSTTTLITFAIHLVLRLLLLPT